MGATLNVAVGIGVTPPEGTPDLNSVINTLEMSDKPVVSAIHGVAAGGGLELALGTHYRVGAPSRVTQNGIFLLAPVLFEFGTDEQKDRILRPMASGEYTWAQAWSEPNTGSDLLYQEIVRFKQEREICASNTWSSRQTSRTCCCWRKPLATRPFQ